MIWQFIDSSSVGGAERHIETLARSLVRHGAGVRVVLLADHGGNPWQQQLAAAGLDCRHLDGRFASLVTALRATPPRLMHTHGYKAGIFGRLAARLTGVPVVSTFHSGERGPFPVGAYELLDDWTSGLGGRIAVSPAIQARLPFSSHLIPSYVVTPSEPPKGPLPPTVAFVGRLSPEKGPDIFCRLAEQAGSRPGFADISWHVWGDGPLRRPLEAAHGRTVQFHGIASDMDTVWPGVGLLAMPSRFEGVPLAALEAAARGIPVLASRIGGLPTVVVDGKSGWLFRPDDDAEAWQGLEAWQTARGTGVDGLRAAGWSLARDGFSEQRWLPSLLAVYRAAGGDAALGR